MKKNVLLFFIDEITYTLIHLFKHVITTQDKLFS